MTNRKKELAKFFAGAESMHAIFHLGLGLSGLLPLTFFGVTLTPTLNIIALAVTLVIAVLLAYYAWFRKEGEKQ